MDQWLAVGSQGPVPTVGTAAGALLERLVAAGLVHPVIGRRPIGSLPSQTIGFVVPVYEDPEGVSRAVSSIRSSWPTAPIVVVDDASSPALVQDSGIGPELGDVAVVRHESNRGPGAARNSGVAALAEEVELVVFVDSDVTLEPDCIDVLVGHFDDPAVVAVAPRIRAEAGLSLLDRYEAVASALDLGEEPSIVRPGSPVPYVPSTVLALRREPFTAVGGFDERLRVGEDVDLVWRLGANGDLVRYEPAATARHRNRRSWAALVHQRHSYGSAAAELDRRHPTKVAPYSGSVSSIGMWALVLVGGRTGVVGAAAVGAYQALRLRHRIGHSVPDSWRQVAELSWFGQRSGARWLAHAVRRAWLPLFITASALSRPARRALRWSFLAPVALDWLGDRPAIDPVRYGAARVIDDVAYCTGLWRGALKARNWRVLLPDALRSDAVRSDAVRSDAVRSDAVRSDAVLPDAPRSDAVLPGDSGIAE